MEALRGSEPPRGATSTVPDAADDGREASAGCEARSRAALPAAPGGEPKGARVCPADCPGICQEFRR